MPLRAIILLAVGLLCVIGGLYVRHGTPLLPDRRGSGRVPRQWATERERMGFSTDGLFVASPQLSARRTLGRRQRDGLVASASALFVGLVLAPHIILLGLVGGCTLAYVGSMTVRLWLFAISIGGTELIRIPDDEALGAPDYLLADYTVMVPVFREPEVMASLVAHLRRLDYPAERLQVLLLAEADDAPTIAAARMAIGAAPDVRILIVPPGARAPNPRLSITV